MMERLQVGKKLESKKPLIIVKVEFLPVADDATRKRVSAALRLLLQPSKGTENQKAETNVWLRQPTERESQ